MPQAQLHKGWPSHVGSPVVPTRRHPVRRKRFSARQGALVAMTLPAVILLFVFNYIPLFGLVIAFEDYRPYQGVFGSAWVGLQNFFFLFQTSQALRATTNTLFLNAIFIVTTLVCSLAVAILLNEIRDRSPRLSNLYQAIMFFPYFMSYVILGYFVFAFLNADNGLLNHILLSLHLQPIDWYSSPQYWTVILALVNLWKSIGFWCIVYLAGILAINPEYYEAARVDGATRWQQIIHITLPSLAPLIIINVLLSIGRIFYADFGLFYQVTRDNPLLYATTDVIDTFVFRSLISLGDVGMAAAAGFYQAIVGFVLVLLSNWIVRRVDAEKALF